VIPFYRRISFLVRQFLSYQVNSFLSPENLLTIFEFLISLSSSNDQFGSAILLIISSVPSRSNGLSKLLIFPSFFQLISDLFSLICDTLADVIFVPITKELAAKLDNPPISTGTALSPEAVTSFNLVYFSL